MMQTNKNKISNNETILNVIGLIFFLILPDLHNEILHIHHIVFSFLFPSNVPRATASVLKSGRVGTNRG
jgi:hypothetical protein